MSRRVSFVVESGTDVRLVEGLAERTPLAVVARRIPGGREISQDTGVPFQADVGPTSFVRFGAHVAWYVIRERRRTAAVIVQGYGVAAFCANMAGRLAGVPVAMLICSPTEAYYRCRLLDAERPFRRGEWEGLRLLAWLNARIGQRYIVLSPYLASVVARHGTRRRIDVVPVYGVDTRVFAPAGEPRDDLRRRLRLPPDAALIFFSSRVAPEKDPDTLLRAVATLRQAGRDVRVVHRSGAHAEFARRARRHGVHEAVIEGPALAPGPELADYYRASDVCVQASREEGLGFSPLEALACGVPVVAAAVGGLRDTIIDGDTGWSYRPGDVEALARAIGDVLDRPTEARRRADRGRALVERVYDRQIVFDRLEVLLGPFGRADHEISARRAIAYEDRART